MTEADWQAARAPLPLLEYAAARLSDADRLRFAAGCCRRIWPLLTDPRLRRLVELAEDVSDGRRDRPELANAEAEMARPGRRELPPPPPALPHFPTPEGQPDPVSARVLYLGGGRAAPLIGGTGIINFWELPAWCRESYYAVRLMVEPNYPAAAVAAATAAGEKAAEDAAETHPHLAAIRDLEAAVDRAAKRVDDLRWRGSGAADGEAVAVRQLRAETAPQIAQLRDAIAADAAAIRVQETAAETAAQADILRCVVGYRAMTPFRPEWRTPTVDGLARGIAAGRAFDRLPVLADALDDAGCDDAELLAHARGDGPHAHGCRVLRAVFLP